MYDLEAPSAAAVISELAPGEQVLWHGRPKQGFALRGLDAGFIPFSVMWVGFVLFGFIELLLRGGGVAVLLFMTPFLLVGIYIGGVRFWLDAKTRAATYYVLTDHRLLFINRWPSNQTKTISLNQIVELKFTHRADGTGTIEFLTSHGLVDRFFTTYYTNRSTTWPFILHFLPPAFEMIANPRQVRQLIQQTQAGLKSEAAPGAR